MRLNIVIYTATGFAVTAAVLKQDWLETGSFVTRTAISLVASQHDGKLLLLSTPVIATETYWREQTPSFAMTRLLNLASSRVFTLISVAQFPEAAREARYVGAVIGQYDGAGGLVKVLTSHTATRASPNPEDVQPLLYGLTLLARLPFADDGLLFGATGLIGVLSGAAMTEVLCNSRSSQQQRLQAQLFGQQFGEFVFSGGLTVLTVMGSTVIDLIYYQPWQRLALPTLAAGQHQLNQDVCYGSAVAACAQLLDQQLTRFIAVDSERQLVIHLIIGCITVPLTGSANFFLAASSSSYLLTQLGLPRSLADNIGFTLGYAVSGCLAATSTWDIVVVAASTACFHGGQAVFKSASTYAGCFWEQATTLAASARSSMPSSLPSMSF